ncbi:hypothetical protein SUGI_0459160 [Cryptomeria japonica]|uniref:uncharacterized protein LOC131032755 n=1 Tax=Cryptomeria japonica TaxID=3369 RepID=UPI002408BE96|nr:uncharacterized protein LOC131032755 [Cryptomeria japonica]GLJ24075.1 hypothetical protein SUGI_0459160 [Cryptomeria japonica]
MQTIISPWSWCKYKHLSHSHNNLVDSGIFFVSSDLYTAHGKCRVSCNNMQKKAIRHGNYFLSKHLLENKKISVQCSLGSAQNKLSTLQQAFKEEEKKEWEESQEPLSALNFSIEEVDAILGKAFGWVHSPYWGEEKRKTLPKKILVSASLSYLRNLGLSDDDLHKLLKKFPEVLGCSLEDDLKNNIAILERDWGIKGNTLRNLLLRNPKVLGYNVDCKGDCMAQCTRCWVRF